MSNILLICFLISGPSDTFQDQLEQQLVAEDLRFSATEMAFIAGGVSSRDDLDRLVAEYDLLIKHTLSRAGIKPGTKAKKAIQKTSGSGHGSSVGLR